MRHHFRRLRRRTLPAAFGLLLFPLATAVIVISDWATGREIAPIVRVLAELPFCVACLVIGTLITSERQNWLTALGLFLGNASYSIYLTHSMFVSIALGLLAKYRQNTAPDLAFGLILVGAVAWGSVVYLYIERPTVKLAERLILRARGEKRPKDPLRNKAAASRVF